MAKLFLKNACDFENPSRLIFLAGELFGGSGEQAKKTETWLKGKESSPEARALAEKVARQAEEIREGTKKELLELYVDLFTTGPIANKESFNAAPFKVDANYAKNGLLQTLEKNSPDLRISFGHTDDLRLLAYATVYQNFKEQGLDANYLPIGADVKLVDGYVTVTYTEGGVTKTATSELFPWSSYEIAKGKYAELMHAEAVAAGKAAEERGISVDLDGDGVDDLPATPAKDPNAPEEPRAPETPVPTVSLEAVREKSEYEKRLDAKVDAFRDEHGLTEEPGRIGLQIMEGTASYVATLKKPDGSTVSVIVRATVDDNADQDGLQKALEKDLDEELARLDKTLDRTNEAPSELDMDWQRVWSSVQQMVNSDTRLQGKVTVSEGRRNARGDDKTILVTNAEGDTLRYMVGVKERKGPKSYGPVEGATPDATRLEDAKAIRVTLLVIGNGDDNKAIGERVSKYNRLEDYRISSVEKGAYNAALIMAGIDPIEEPDSPSFIETVFKGRRDRLPAPDRERSDAVRPEKPREIPLAPISEVKELLKVYPTRIQVPVDDITDNTPYLGFVEQVSETRKLLTDPDAGFASYYVQFETPNGERITVTAHPEFITEQQVDAYIKANGGVLPEGVTHDDVKLYLAYNALENMLAKELWKAKRDIQKLMEKSDGRRKVPEADHPEAITDPIRPAKERMVEAANALHMSTLLSPEQLRTNNIYFLSNSYTQVRLFVDAYAPYLQVTSKDMPAPKADGSARWSVMLTTADGENIPVQAAAMPVDAAQVDAFVKAQAELGKTFSREDVVTYAGYLQMQNVWATAIEAAKRENMLDDKFKAYKAKPENAPVAVPTAAPTAQPTGVPGLKEGRYTKIDPAMITLDEERPQTGLTELEWADGTTFKGELKAGIPDGMGLLTLGGSDKTLGPVEFKNGVAEIALPEGKKKVITWDAERAIFDIKE